MDATKTSRRRLVALALTAASLLVPAAAPSSAAAACANAGAHPSDVSVDTIRVSTLCLLNEERADHNLRKLRHNDRLASAARAHALDMVRRNYFDHTSRNGADFIDRILKADYVDRGEGWTLGENLAWGSHELATPRSTVRSWMKSPGHKRNILSGRFKEIGIGIVRGSPRPDVSRAATYATDFGTRL